MSTLGDIVAGLKEVVLLNDKVERLGDGATKLADGFEAQRQMLVELRHQLQETTRELERTLARMEALEARLADAERDRQGVSERLVRIEAQWQLVKEIRAAGRVGERSDGSPALPAPE